MDIDLLWDSRKFHQKLDNLRTALKKKNISEDDLKDYVVEFLEVCGEKPFPAMSVDVESKPKPIHKPEPVDNLKILLEAKAKGQRVIYLPDISQGEIHKLWQEADMGWTPQFQATNNGWKIADDMVKLQSGSVG